MPPRSAILPPSTQLQALSHRDVSRRALARKGRHLLLLPGLMAPSRAGPLGTIAGLDSRNPTLTITFPQGRLRFLGTIVYPKTRYLIMRPGPKDLVTCEVRCGCGCRCGCG